MELSKEAILAIIYINISLYALCFQVQRPLEPYLMDQLVKGDSATEFAKLQSFFSIMQTVGSFATGYVLDRTGPKFGFIVSFVASALSYYLLSISTDINILYMSKIPTIFQAGFLCAQVAISQITADGPERITALGRLTMAYTVGSTIGPTVGGMLGANGNYFFAAKLAVVGSLISVVLSLFLPNKNLSKETSVKSSEASQSQQPQENRMSLVIRLVWLLLFTKVVTSVANSMQSAALPLIIKNVYKLNEVYLGYIMSSMSFVNAVVNGILLGPVTRFFGSSVLRLIETSILAMTALFFIQGFISSSSAISISSSNGLYEFIGSILVLTIFQYMLSTAITGESTGRVPNTAKGTLVGIEHSLFALARIPTPQMGINLLNHGGVSSVAYACGGVFLFVDAVWFLFKSTLTDKSKKFDDNNNESKEEERKEK